MFRLQCGTEPGQQGKDRDWIGGKQVIEQQGISLCLGAGDRIQFREIVKGIPHPGGREIAGVKFCQPRGLHGKLELRESRSGVLRNQLEIRAVFRMQPPAGRTVRLGNGTDGMEFLRRFEPEFGIKFKDAVVSKEINHPAAILPVTQNLFNQETA